MGASTMKEDGHAHGSKVEITPVVKPHLDDGHAH